MIFVTEGETSWFTALFSLLFHCVFGQPEVKNTTDEVILEIVKTRSKQNKVIVPCQAAKQVTLVKRDEAQEGNARGQRLSTSKKSRKKKQINHCCGKPEKRKKYYRRYPLPDFISAAFEVGHVSLSHLPLP